MQASLNGTNDIPVLPGLNGRVLLATAGTSGIGLATARIFAASGAKAVILNGRNALRGEQVRSELASQWPRTRFEFHAADLTDESQVAQMFEQIARQTSAIDTLVHSGGAQLRPMLFTDTKVADFRPMIDGHFTAILHVCHHAIPLLTGQKDASIVVVASDAGKLATPAESLIGAAKAAAIMFVRCLGMELSRQGIRANAVTPSIVRDTISYDRVMSGELSRKVFEKAESRARLGVPTPIDVASLAAFLASPLAGRITGQAVSVNGGISAA